MEENVKTRCVTQKGLKDIFSLMLNMSRVNHAESLKIAYTIL